jgi:uncharacterized protein (DUF2147 family)
MKNINILLFLFFFGISDAINANPNIALGVWFTQNKDAKIEIFKEGNTYSGKIVWLKQPLEKNGKPKIDERNPDKNLVGQPILGIKLMTKFEFKGNNYYDNGKVYDPESGKTYSCNMKINEKGELEVRGYLGISLFGRTETWTRATND